MLLTEIGFHGELRGCCFFLILHTFNSSPKNFEAQEQNDPKGYRAALIRNVPLQLSVNTPHFTNILHIQPGPLPSPSTICFLLCTSQSPPVWLQATDWRQFTQECSSLSRYVWTCTVHRLRPWVLMRTWRALDWTSSHLLPLEGPMNTKITADKTSVTSPLYRQCP